MDLKTDLDKAAAHHEINTGEECIKLGLKKPDPLDITELERASFDLNEQIFDQEEKLEAIDEEFGVAGPDEAEDALSERDYKRYQRERNRATQGIDIELMLPRIEFIAEHIVSADSEKGVTYGDVDDWRQFPREVQVRFLRHCGLESIWDLYGKLVEIAGLGADEKKP